MEAPSKESPTRQMLKNYWGKVRVVAESPAKQMTEIACVYILRNLNWKPVDDIVFNPICMTELLWAIYNLENNTDNDLGTKEKKVTYHSPN